jgi:signal transduction histidine kinase
MYAWARVAYNILDAYNSTGHFDRAALWIDSVEVAINKMSASPECPPQKAEEYLGSFYTHKACVLAMTGHKAEADKVYEKFLQLDYAHTNIGLIDNAEYLEMAKRWNDRANLTPSIDSLMKAWGTPMSLYYLRAYQIPNFKAYLKAGRREEALMTAEMIAENIDSIEDYERKHNAAELSIIFETQEKELKITEQQAQLRYQRMIAVAAASLLLVIFLAIFMYFRNRAAIKLAEKNRELQHKNIELTIANARAEESSRMKTNFIQQISHEIRTPLNILSGFTQIVTAKDIAIDEATRTEANEKIAENTNRITGLVNKLLELSDINSQTVIETNDHVSPEQIAATAVMDSGIAGAAHISFELKIDKAIDPQTLLHTNGRQASRALELLLDNAQKFTKQGNVTLSVSGTPDGFVAFAVEDTGIGVPVYEAERIFNEFVQLDEFSDGTGIGLAVARSITRRLGGDIVLDTTYKGGARFVMTLPVS